MQHLLVLLLDAPGWGGKRASIECCCWMRRPAARARGRHTPHRASPNQPARPSCLPAPPPSPTQIRASFSPGGDYITCGSDDGWVYLWGTHKSAVPAAGGAAAAAAAANPLAKARRGRGREQLRG